MADALFLFVAASPDTATRWWRVAGARLIARGDDLGQVGAMPGERVIALLPASLCPIAWQSVPPLPPAQRDAVIAAQLHAAQSFADEDVHLVTGESADDLAPVARIDRVWLRTLLARLAVQGFVPDRLLPAALLAAPGETLDVGNERLMRIGAHACVAEPALRAALGGDQDQAPVSDAHLLERLIAQSENPLLDLRRHEFTPAPPRWLDVSQTRVLAMAAVLLALLALLIPVASLIRLEQARAAVDDQTRAAAQPLFATAPDPQAALASALRARQGPGAGFVPSAAAMTEAILALRGAELGEMSFDRSGRLHVVARLAHAADRALLIAALELRGFNVTTGAQSEQQGRFLIALSMTAS